MIKFIFIRELFVSYPLKLVWISEDGYTFWESIPKDSCGFNKYGTLYNGRASKVLSHDVSGIHTVYSLESGEITFALKAKSFEKVCGYEITKTKHPKLLIFESKGRSPFLSNKNQRVENLDFYAYVNSKFVYVEKNYVEKNIRRTKS